MRRMLYLLFLFSILSLRITNVFAQTEAGDQRSSLSPKESIISIYPLPANGTLHIAFNKTMGDVPFVLLYDMLGNVVEDINLERESSGTFTINLSGKHPGFYFIKVQSGEESFSRRITVTQ